MELHKRRKVLGVLAFSIGLLTALVALETVRDPNTRHAVAGLGVAVELVGVVMMLRANRSART